MPLQLIAATIPSPSQSVWELGPFPLRGYALCIILGIVAAIWIGERRWQVRGGTVGDVQDIAVWAVPFGLVGARLYHVATDWKRYFGEGGDPVEALYVWQGGLGIWGGVALGAVGAWLGCRRKGIRILPLMDAVAPGLLVAQAIGRWGNWFNQELYGRPTDLPWALEIDQDHFSSAYLASQDYRDAVAANGGVPPEVATFHPTFLYECLWNLAAFALIIWLDRRFRLGHGRVMAAYVMAYTLGRGWIEYIRIDDVQLDDVLGLRFNVWTSIVLFVAAAVYFWWSRRHRPGREESVYVDGREPAEEAAPDDEASPTESRDAADVTDEASTSD
ncbi:prolipoprotein diacylglyceryl transferase [Nocardioides sp. SYSU DS0651]|uniref:prolipoprotein diacylglyceryl transferase n=1 Tax=Nocardioides sp. SYSU DS0651 TaxID=3415955 RepID=UPI003F4C417F